MSLDPEKVLALHDPRAGALMRVPAPHGFPIGLFCASPTILEAINNVLYHRGLPTLWVQMDGTIGPSDPLLLRIEYVPSPFEL